jgi:hypothetical protein
MIEMAEDVYKIDIKKNFLANPPLVLGQKEGPQSEDECSF